jgi:hypothetical protein
MTMIFAFPILIGPHLYKCRVKLVSRVNPQTDATRGSVLDGSSWVWSRPVSGYDEPTNRVSQNDMIFKRYPKQWSHQFAKNKSVSVSL